MPIIIQAPPPVDLPKTVMEYVVADLTEDQLDIAPELKTLHLDEDYYESVFLKNKFESLTVLWEQNTKFSSSISRIIEDENFLKIVGMGEKAIPFIIEDIQKKPSTLVWALNLITGKTLQTNYRITITDACKAWVKLWNSQARG